MNNFLKMRDLDAVIGVNAFNEFVHNDTTQQNIDNFVKHAVYIADKIGGRTRWLWI